MQGFEQFRSFRKNQLESLFLNLNIPVSGDVLLSIGCGSAAELDLVDYAQVFALDHDVRIINFLRKNFNATLIHQDYIKFLESRNDNEFNLILALDIDTNISPEILLRLAMKKLKKGGSLVMTERQDNIRIYKRMLILPFISQLKHLTNFKLFTRLQEVVDPNDRDNVVLLFTKLE